MEYNLTKKERLIIHSNHIKITSLLIITGLIVPTVGLICKDGNESFNLCYFIPTFVFILAAITTDLRRRCILRKMLTIKLNFRKAYELQKHRSKNNIYNLHWLMTISFFDGDFQQSIIYANEILILSPNKRYFEYAIFFITLSSFLLEKNIDTLSLIKASPRKNSLYYKFIKAYLCEQYDVAIITMQTVLKNKNTKNNNIEKVLANYFNRMAYLKKEDYRNAQNCIVEILVADKKRNTYFSKNIGAIQTSRQR